MTKEEFKQYTQEFLTKQGVPAERVTAILEHALGDETVAKAFVDGFVPRPDYSRDLDKVRDEWKGKADQASQVATRYEEWYTKEAKPFWDKAQTDVAAAQRYRELYGPLDDTNNPQNPGPTRTAITPTNVVTREDLESILKARDQAYTKLSLTVPEITLDYYQRFGEKPNLQEFEKFAVEQNLEPATAYKLWIQPRVQAQEKVAIDAKLKQAYEDGAKDALSKHKLPVPNTASAPHPLFDAKPVDPKEPAFQADERGLQAFMDGWNQAAEQPKPA